EHAKTLAAFAAQAGLALHNASLFAETSELLQREQRLNGILQMIGSSLDLSVVLNDILSASCELIGADAGILGLLDARGETITAVNHHNLDLINQIPVMQHGEGISWDVIDGGKAILLDDYFTHPSARQALKPAGIHSALCAPVRSGTEILGVLTFYTTVPDKKFQPRDLQLAEAIGREAGVSIQNSRLFTSARRRAEEAETVREAASAVSSALELNWVLDQIITNLEKVVPFDSCAVFLQESDRLRIVAARGFADPVKVLGQSFTLENPLTTNAFQTRKAVILADASQEPLFAGWGDAAHVRGWMGVPLFVRGTIIGLLTIDSRTVGAYDEDDASLAQTFGNQAAVAIENARLFEKVQHLAITDPLTELYNRRHFFELARREFYRARRYGTPMSMLMLDVDDLKLVNDTFGHQIGDQLVEFIGAQCRNQLRQVDIPSRYAGDEFIIALPETTLAGAIQVAQRIREQTSQGFMADGQNLVPAAVSIGVSEMDSGCFSLETLINRADQALYSAKQAGKNQVVAWQVGQFGPNPQHEVNPQKSL
ncbi:MAG TPA: diguanylate cyclase, partial [Bellilinea sp.]